MQKILKYVVAPLAVLAGLVGLAYGLATWRAEQKMQRTVDVRVVPVAAATGPAALRLGKYLFESRGCGECHGMDGRGKVVVDSGGMYVRAPNLTAGKASAVAAYGDGDWVRAIRHGVDPRGRPLLIMPSEDYNRMNDADLAALVAYVKGLPPKDGETASVRLPAMAKVAYALGLMRDAADKIDHRLPPAAPVPVGVSVEHGAYVANMCIGCHGEHFSGGKIPGAPPDWPPASNLTPGEGTVMERYDTAEKLAAMMRTGRRPDGSEVSRVMPFESLRNFNDVDIQAMHAFLGTLPPRKAGRR